MRFDELEKGISVARDNGWITVEAPAKINLYLTVKRRRQDGYHEIESLMQKIELADRLHIRARKEGVRLFCPGTNLPENENNLAFQAANVFFNKADLPQSTEAAGVEIVLEKKIPVAAGLGGGSSDAAAVLRSLNVLFDAGMNQQQLLTLAKPLGADIPFFVADYTTVWATGIGDNLEQADSLENYWIVLVNPGFAVSTKWVYENFALTTAGNTFILARNPETENVDLSCPPPMPSGLHNDLEAVTIHRFPEIEMIKQKLLLNGAVGVLMSGSGPTVFGLFEDQTRAVQSFEDFVRKYGGNVFITRPYQAVKTVF